MNTINEMLSGKDLIHSTGEATGFIPAPGDKGKPITVIGTPAIRETFDAKCIEQALNSRGAPGVTDLILNPDAHCGYGAPVSCVLVSPTHIYPGPVGVDIKCSMSFLQLDLPADQITERTTRRAIIDAIVERTPTGLAKANARLQSLAKFRLSLDGAWRSKALHLKFAKHWGFRPSGRSTAKMLSISATTARAMIWKFALMSCCAPGCSRSLRKRYASLVPMAAAIILVNAKWCRLRIMIAHAGSLRSSD